MIPTISRVVPDDVPTLTTLYHSLSAEMEALRPMWPLADGIAEPVADSLTAMTDDPTWLMYVGRIEEHIVGFLFGHDEPLLPQADGERIGSIRFIYTDPGAREVGVGEAMVGAFITDAQARGIRRFDAHVSPGHRHAKNFFESHGFKARAIVMHRDET